MAAGAGGLQFDLFGVSFVARLAGRFLMAAAQRKFGVLVMIEANGFPQNLAMTVVATGAVYPFMHVTGLVAINTGGPELGRLHGRRMAQRARQRAMPAA